jgi:predicted metallo-beta-lactamase superfamily hydrolase
MDYKIIISFVSDLIKSTRKLKITCCYLISLMVPADKHSQANAEKISGKENSLFSKMLTNTLELSTTALNRSSRRRLKKLMKKRKTVVDRTPWKIAILIDATLHRRSSRHIENSKKFNHGQGGF